MRMCSLGGWKYTVTESIKILQNGGSVAKAADGGGDDFNGGGVGDTSRTEDFTFTGLAFYDTSFALMETENAVQIISFQY